MAMWAAGWALPGLLTCLTSRGEAGNLTLLFINLRKPNKQSLLEARPDLPWTSGKCYPISQSLLAALGGHGVKRGSEHVDDFPTGRADRGWDTFGMSHRMVRGSSHLVRVCEAKHKERGQCVLEPSAWHTHLRPPHHTPACFSS